MSRQQSRVVDVSFTPNPLIAGDRVAISLRLIDADDVTSVIGYGPMNERFEFERTDGDKNSYSTELEVPSNTSSGVYCGTVVLMDGISEIERKAVYFTIA